MYYFIGVWFYELYLSLRSVPNLFDKFKQFGCNHYFHFFLNICNKCLNTLERSIFDQNLKFNKILLQKLCTDTCNLCEIKFYTWTLSFSEFLSRNIDLTRNVSRPSQPSIHNREICLFLGVLKIGRSRLGIPKLI